MSTTCKNRTTSFKGVNSTEGLSELRHMGSIHASLHGDPDLDLGLLMSMAVAFPPQRSN